MNLSHLVNGEWTAGTGPETLNANPARPQDVVASYREVDGDLIDLAADAAAHTALGWRRTSVHQRAAVLDRAAALLTSRREDLGRELSQEEGKPLGEGIAEVDRAARIFRYYAAEADRELGAVFASGRPSERVYTRQVPVGPVVLITPWNFPIAIPAWKLAPALVYGNSVVWKPSPVTPKLAVRLSEVLVEAGLPDGVLNVVLGGADAARRLLDHQAIRACSFTGSTAAGRSVVATAARRGLKVQAEMGGLNVAVVLEDADLDVAAGAIVLGAMGSTGQKCTATSRVLVDRAIHGELLERIVAGCRALRVGDPLDAATDLGPVATPGQLQAIRAALDDVDTGRSRVLLDGDPARDPSGGYFVGPSVIDDADGNHRVSTEEVFGPVVAVSPVQGRDAAFTEANAGEFGLSASVFTTDLGTAELASECLDVGVLHINSETTGAEPHVPFGGMKASGWGGREQGRAARDFYTETRTVYVS